MKDYSFYILAAYCFCFISLIFLIFLSKLFLLDTKKRLKEINKNEFIGYNKTFKTKKKITVAILGIGYADGISRILSNKGKVYSNNQSFKILGRISMDSITIDISQKSNLLKVGDYMELINHAHGIDKMAKQCNTISHEILTSISKRVNRVYV